MVTQRTGIATFGLDYGRCPPWLFNKMKRLARLLTEAIVYEYSPTEFIRRMSDPFFFQSFGTILAFDWDASGLTTTTTAAIKEALRGTERGLGIFVAGGKGKTSRKTPDDIRAHFDKYQLSMTRSKIATLAERDNKCDELIYSSRMSAKVDNTAIQDGFQLYHHAFFFDRRGNWAVVQQGMSTPTKKTSAGKTPPRKTPGVSPPTPGVRESAGLGNAEVGESVASEQGLARRYHWLGEKVSDFVEEPHTGIINPSEPWRSGAQPQKKKVLNLTAKESRNTKTTSVGLVNEPQTLMKDLKVLFPSVSEERRFLPKARFLDYVGMPFDRRRLEKTLRSASEQAPENYEKLLAIKGVGPKTIRALSLISEVIYGAKPSYQDPARYSYAHGGKDGIPYFVDRKTYDQSIKVLEKAVRKAKMGSLERQEAFKKLEKYL